MDERLESFLTFPWLLVSGEHVIFSISIAPPPPSRSPLDIERIARAERLAIDEQEEPRALAVREVVHGLDHRLDALARRRDRQNTYRLNAEMRRIRLCPSKYRDRA
jgi:hypothetical protein